MDYDKRGYMDAMAAQKYAQAGEINAQYQSGIDVGGSPIARLASTHVLVGQLCEMVDRLANRLAGPVPPQPMNTTAERGPSSDDGVFPLIDRLAADTSSRVQYAMESINRIERVLP